VGVLHQTFSGDMTMTNVWMLIQPASVLDSAKVIAKLFETIGLVSGGEMAEWLKATVC
jgi:hypothetical protein